MMWRAHMVAVFLLVSSSCSEKPRPSLVPSVSVAATLAPGFSPFEVRIALQIPDGYRRQRELFPDAVTWVSDEERSPSVKIHLAAAPPYQGKNQCSVLEEDRATAYEASPDRIARQCRGLVARYLRVKVSQELTDIDWWVGCEVNYKNDRPTPSDIKSIDDLCASIRWQVEDRQKNRAP